MFATQEQPPQLFVAHANYYIFDTGKNAKAYSLKTIDRSATHDAGHCTTRATDGTTG
jgi:hypothetical protein